MLFVFFPELKLTSPLKLVFHKMVIFIRVGWVLVCLLFNLSQQDGDFNEHELKNFLYQTKGNFTILGIFVSRFGSDCNEESEKGLEEIASAIWTVEALNKYRYLPGITIGLTIYGVCENFNYLSTPFENLEQHLGINKDNVYIGILTSLEIYKNIQPLGGILKCGVVHLEHVISADIISHAVTQLLINLQWMNVSTVISDSPDILKSFREKATEEGIVIRNELLINSDSSIVNPKGLEKTKVSPVIVTMASFAKISNISQELFDENPKLILSPTDFIFDADLIDLPNDTIISLPSMENKTVLSKYIKNVRRHKKLFNYKHPRGPLFIGTAASILKLLKPFRSAFEKNCQNAELHLERPCASAAYFINEAQGNKTGSLTQKSMKISPDDVEETLKVLKIEPSSNDEMFLYISSVINNNAGEDLAIFKIFSLKTKKFEPFLAMINDDLLKNRDAANDSGVKTEYLKSKINGSSLGKIQTHPDIVKPIFNSFQNSLENVKTVSEQLKNNASIKKCESQGFPTGNLTCLNLTMNYTTATLINDATENNTYVAWRFLAWVSIDVSLGFVGVTCTLSTMLFLIIRLCKRDIIDGTPFFFTLLLMISVILTYISSLPFHMEFSPGDLFICNYRKYGPPTVFAVLFSLLLSRSVLLAFEGNNEGFSNHTNGYLQFVLCIFMLGIQVSLVAQNWIFEADLYCADVYNKYKMFLSLCYDFLLLMLLACVSPFIIRSRQNYKEGLLFSITVFFITIVWSAWISFYIFLPNEYKDAAVAIGLNSTASVFLFCIFIPQTYFMSEPLGRDMALRSFSSLTGNILADNFKSNQTFEKNSFGTIVYKNCETGFSNPNFSGSRSNEGENPIMTDDLAKETDVQVSSEASQPI